MTLLLVDEKMRPVDGPYEVRLYGWTEDRYYAEAPESRICEFKDGEVIVHCAATPGHQSIVQFLTVLLALYVEERGLGNVYNGPATLRLRPGLDREPDILFLDVASRPRIGEKRIEGAASFIIEVLSPDSHRRDLEEKLAEYEEHGVEEYWVVDPFERAVLVHRRGEKGFEVERRSAGRLESRAVPGFWIDAGWLWDRPLPPGLRCLREVLGGFEI